MNRSAIATRTKWAAAIATLTATALLSSRAVVQTQEPPPPQSPAQQPETPRFRAGANLVRLDAYVTANGQPLGDLTINDFEVLEDGKPQRLESFEIVKPRGVAPDTARIEPNNVRVSEAMAASPDARLFVLFMDLYHVRVEGSHRAQGPIIRLLDRVIGQDDLVGVMTSDMTPRELTLGRRTDTMAAILREYWYWGQATFERKLVEDPIEEGLRHCYPEQTEPGLAIGVIKRLREQQMLDALGNLIEHLEAIREERKFVILLTEGWQLFKPSEALQRPTKKADGSPGFAPGLPPPLGVNPQTGQLGVTNDASAWDVCERQRSLAAMLDNEQHFRTLVQRANRANVSFYPIDTRGLVVFDSDIRDPLPLALDLAVLRTKHENLRVLAGETDGFAVVDTGNIDRALERMVADTSLYYLLGYYSTNTRLDGRFRKLTVRVKRRDADVRARPGYLAPTEAEMSAAMRPPVAVKTVASEVRDALAAVTRFRADAPPKTPGVIFRAKGLLAPTASVSRRGPSTGLQYVATLDPRFRRTERIRLEVPRLTSDGVATARLLTKLGEPMPIAVALTEQTAPSGDRVIVADLTLAPLAQADYVLEVAVSRAGLTEFALFGFRIVP